MSTTVSTASSWKSFRISGQASALITGAGKASPEVSMST